MYFHLLSQKALFIKNSAQGGLYVKLLETWVSATLLPPPSTLNSAEETDLSTGEMAAKGSCQAYKAVEIKRTLIYTKRLVSQKYNKDKVKGSD